MKKRKKIIAGNWKMNKTAADARKLAMELFAVQLVPAGAEVVIIPPAMYLSEFTTYTRNPLIAMGAQNCYHEKEGAYTGEISAYMLKQAGISYCLVGHSERRKYFNENDLTCIQKVKAILAEELTPVLCVGEELELRESGKYFDFVKKQLLPVLTSLKPTQLTKVVIAYEPVWAIGTGKTATVAQASEMHTFIRKMITQQFDAKIAAQVHILYGGSVTDANAAELMAAPDVDGVLVGGASLKADVFAKIIAAAAQAQ